MTDTTTTATPADAKPPPLRAFGEAAGLTAGLVHIIDDDPDAVARLLEVAGTGRFAHKVAEIRNQRESDKAHAQAAEQFAAQGYTVLDEYPRYGDTGRVELRYLRTPDGAAATEEAITDPEHWAVYLSEDTAYADKETGELIDGDDIDWHCRFNGSGEPDEGMRHPESVTERVVFEPDWFCIDYAAAGLELCDILAKRAQAIARENAGGAGNDDDHDDEARAAAQAEAERRERRKVIALNKLGDAAQQVRRQFIAEKLLTRKTAPKGGAIFVAHCLTRDVRLVEEYRGGEIAAEMLGVADLQAVHQLVAELAASGDGRAQVITLALVLGALEARAPKDAWRGTGGYGRYVGPAELHQLPGRQRIPALRRGARHGRRANRRRGFRRPQPEGPTRRRQRVSATRCGAGAPRPAPHLDGHPRSPTPRHTEQRHCK